MALVTLRSGQASVDLVARLFNAIGAARFLHEAAHGRESPEQVRFEVAGQALLECASRIRDGQSAPLSEADLALLEQMVTLHDAQMTITPLHELQAARRRVDRWLTQCQQLDAMTGWHTGGGLTSSND
ncbi:hypothetical protein WT50_26025 [Burkholderia territorii]|nr:hypothetical protein WT50_26025 [Burkholderia territorii]KWE47271.1 hypothetical protein WT51_16190 [Burkholderia territorii]